MNVRLAPLLILALFAAAFALMRANDHKYLADEGRLGVFEAPARDAVILFWSFPVGAPPGESMEVHCVGPGGTWYGTSAL